MVSDGPQGIPTNCIVMCLIVDVVPIMEEVTYGQVICYSSTGTVVWSGELKNSRIVGYMVTMKRLTVAPTLSWEVIGSFPRCYSPSGYSILFSKTGSDPESRMTETFFPAMTAETVFCHFLNDGLTVKKPMVLALNGVRRSVNVPLEPVRADAGDLVIEVLVRLFATTPTTVAQTTDVMAPTQVTAAPAMATEGRVKVSATPAADVEALTKVGAASTIASVKSKMTGGLILLAI